MIRVAVCDTLARHRLSVAEIERLRGVLRKLELANDRVCGARPQRVYDAMIASGMSDALLALDEARREARAALGDAS